MGARRLARLIASLYLTRMTWRADAEPYGRRSHLFQVVLHPKQFANRRASVKSDLRQLGDSLIVVRPILCEWWANIMRVAISE